jgi:hypothetical protein
MSSTTFTGVAKFDFTYAFNRSWSVFAEGGYRYLKTAQFTPNYTGGNMPNGSGIFRDPNSGNFVPLSLDLSGPFIATGVGYTF